MLGPTLADVAMFLSGLTGDDGHRPICWDEGPEVVVKCVGLRVVSDVCERFGDAIYSIDGRTLEQVVSGLMVSNHFSVGTAESCTGGLIGQLLTSVAGSSGFYAGGFITYSNDSKICLLSVPAGIINEHGAVSEDVAGLMASGVREKLGVDVAVAVSGVAGPGGGADAKPVGTVCFGIASENGVTTRTNQINGDRGEVRAASALYALDLLRRWAVANGGDAELWDVAGQDCMN